MNDKVMNKISYGLYVLTAKDDAKQNGCIINTLEQVANTPARVSISVSKANYTHDIIVKTGEFNVSILSEKATFDIFKHFGFQSGRDVNKFADYPMGVAENGIAYVTEGTNGYVSGKVLQSLDLGSHTMFIADVTGGEVFNEDASATYDYYHKNIKTAPDEKVSSGSWVCKICGYVYEGDPIPKDFICPWCKHPASDFEKK